MLDDFRVIATDLPNLPGVPAHVTVAFGGKVNVLQCLPKHVDPPEYTRLKRLAAELMVADLENKLAVLEETRTRLKSQLKELRIVADPQGEQKRQLAAIHGLGPKRCEALLDHFGSIEAIRQASVEELAAVRGMNKGAVEAVREGMGEGLEL